ncbi:hypothetical protein [Runella aurantiaca]|uniref:Uncharacterized protein n=1 Tax=Runella aurantiaca TaxID=2282308 RepID=A0A369I4J0_9BACT|nr:hypothetical protein [Runella aurantiaca]RDB03417.1 hypothetical protein DVG78_24035 [Runella aurantiaca]
MRKATVSLSTQFSDEKMLTELTENYTLYETGPNISNDMKLLFRKFHEVDEDGLRPDGKTQHFGIAISKRELLEILDGDDCIALQICFGFQHDGSHNNINNIPKLAILDNATVLVLSRIETITNATGTKINRNNEAYWTTSADIKPTDVDCPPYVTNCKKPEER